MANPLRITDKVSTVNEEEELRKRGYLLGVTLGEGSYAKVKSAYSERHGKKIAIKIINKKKAPKDFQQKFLPRELDILKILHHPNVIELYEILQFNNKVYIMMEMAGHGDLLEYIKLRGAIPEEKSKRTFFQIVTAVGYLHGQNIIHRDLKCENILLDTQNNVKLSDFGFARLLGAGEISKTFCGSAAYAAPEILQGIPYTGFAYDVWSMGVILYIMVCGSMPYDDSNIKKMIKYQTERKVGFSKSKKVSETCKNLIHSMLEANVKLRATIPDTLNHPWLQNAAAQSGMEDSMGSDHTTVSVDGSSTRKHGGADSGRRTEKESGSSKPQDDRRMNINTDESATAKADRRGMTIV
jgi:serine kinase